MIDQAQSVDPEKAAKSASNRAYRIANRDAIIARERAFYQANRDAMILKARRYRDDPENKIKIAAFKKEWGIKNADKVKKSRSLRYCMNPEASKAATKRWQQTHPEKLSAIQRRARAKAKVRHPGKAHDYHAAWRAKNPDRVKNQSREAMRRFRATPLGALKGRMSSAIYQAIRQNKSGRKWESIVGYTVHDLQKHLESRFTPGMSWVKLLAGEIELDHVIPISKFNYTKPEDPQFRQCWALDNLQPLWSKHNRSKNCRLEKHEQIPLGI